MLVARAKLQRGAPGVLVRQKPPENWECAAVLTRQTSFGRAKLTSFQGTQSVARSDVTNRCQLDHHRPTMQT
jgi:hypothetical protein